ncbi:hypothetical protein FDG2_3739 [Candidatus Protofrankia californiensis]|uniref:Uncharacterized protein n=1 Tax=Candidatus Protofrankia californiensis TaxID=1839754 RepID=A0A1C3P0J7_9ACTN|nr:hypothetical protein FDG2_3739 [Candidatus Protofrankia californiensis]
MRLARGGAEPGPATVEQVVRILEEYVGGLPAAGPDEPYTFVRTWTLTHTLFDTPLSNASLADVPLPGASLRVGCTVVRRFAEDDRSGEADDQRTYEQLVGAAQVLAAGGFPSEEVYEGWRTVAIDLRPSATPIPVPTETDATGKKVEKKRRRGLWRSAPVAA